jgi:glucosamine 6-phosphate synthetase-like amidotransferase/phosphosugar isomerase protein
MAGDVYEQLLKIPRSQLVDVALGELNRQGEQVGRVIERVQREGVQRQLDEVVDAVSIKRIYMVGCGDSYFAALSARHAFERLTGLPTVAVESMEFARYTLLVPDSLVIVISSGGEVSMTLEAGRVARAADVNSTGIAVIGITAQEDSRLAREFACLVTNPGLSDSEPADQVALVLGNYSLSLAALYLVALHIGQRRGYLDDEVVGRIQAEVEAIPNAIEEAMGYSTEIRDYVEGVSDEADFFFLGAGPSYGVALFYQAKFFEQAQRPVYGVQLEEFAHEQFFLLRRSENAQVWFVVPPGLGQERALEVMASCREMDARVIAVTTSLNDDQVRENASLTFSVKATPEVLSPLVSVVPGEVLGICAFARWGGGDSFVSNRRRQMAIGKRLTRESARVRIQRNTRNAKRRMQ